MRINYLCRRIAICKLFVCLTLGITYLFFGNVFSYVYDVAHGELPCFIDHQIRNNVKYMLSNFDQLMRQYNLTYWIDYGTLLGAYRNGFMIRYDQDADLGYWYKDREIIDYQIAPILRQRGIIVNNPHITVQLEYKGVKADLFAYETYKKLSKKLPKGKTERTMTRAYYRNSDFFEQTYSDAEHAWIHPISDCPFEDLTLMCPQNPEQILKVRYPYTFPYGIRLPFKFWCYANPKSFVKVLIS